MHQKMSRGLNFPIMEVEELDGDHEANVCLCSRIYKSKFSYVAQLSINLLANFNYTAAVLMHTNQIKTR